MLAGSLLLLTAALQGEPRAPEALTAPLQAWPARLESVIAEGRFDRGLVRPGFDAAPLPEAGGVAWWRSSESGVRWVDERTGPKWDAGSVELEPGAWIEQPIARVFGIEAGAQLTVAGVGDAIVELRGSGGALRQARTLEDQQTTGLRLPSTWVLGAEEWLGDGADPSGRLTLRVTAGEAGLWLEGIDLLVPLPAPGPEALREHLIEVAEWAFEPWFERACDRVGPTETGFLVQNFDALDGRLLGEPKRRVTLHPIWMQLLDAQAAAPRESWAGPLEAFIGDYLTLGLNSDTGLPQYYDPVADVALPDAPMEIGLHLEWLLDVAQRGPERFRSDALEAARRIGETVLLRGPLPDGNVAAKYRPSDGQPITSTVELRRLDVPAQLVRLGVALGDDRYRAIAVAREAVLTFEYDHLWPGTWDGIDPGFDDMYGHYGARTAVMWAAEPDEASFREVALGGFEFFAPLWRGALQHGGNVAADQVRCWKIAIDLVRADPTLAERVADLLREAVQVHWAGQQDGAGRWVDVTVRGFDPQILPVGDTAGVPQNLLEGLAAIVGAREELGLGPAEVEWLLARFAAVEQRTLAAFGGPYGLVPGSTRSPGVPQPAIGSVRLLGGVVELLDALSE